MARRGTKRTPKHPASPIVTGCILLILFGAFAGIYSGSNSISPVSHGAVIVSIVFMVIALIVIIVGIASKTRLYEVIKVTK